MSQLIIFKNYLFFFKKSCLSETVPTFGHSSLAVLKAFSSAKEIQVGVCLCVSSSSPQIQLPPLHWLSCSHGASDKNHPCKLALT